jgi:hypothetical protein
VFICVHLQFAYTYAFVLCKYKYLHTVFMCIPLYTVYAYSCMDSPTLTSRTHSDCVNISTPVLCSYAFSSAVFYVYTVHVHICTSILRTYAHLNCANKNNTCTMFICVHLYCVHMCTPVLYSYVYIYTVYICIDLHWM